MLSDSELLQEIGLAKDENDGDLRFEFKGYNKAIMKSFLQHLPNTFFADQSKLHKLNSMQPPTSPTHASKDSLIKNLSVLNNMSLEELLDRRYKRLVEIGI